MIFLDGLDFFGIFKDSVSHYKEIGMDFLMFLQRWIFVGSFKDTQFFTSRKLAMDFWIFWFGSLVF